MIRVNPSNRAIHVPNDILVLVFLAALPHIRSSIDIGPLSSTQAPLNISQVCRHWRNVVLSTPQLWTQVHFDLRRFELFSKAAVVATAVPVIISRSAQCPLDLKVIFCRGRWDDPLLDSPTGEDWSPLASSILRALLSARQRWRIAMVVAPLNIWQEGFDEESEWCISDLNNAQELRIGGPNVRLEGQPELRRDRHVDGQFVLDISSATVLERITLSQFFKSTIRVDNAFPRLRSFRVKRRSQEVPLSTIFQILQSSPALEEVCWPMSAHSKLRIPNEGFPRLRLENLRSLALRYVHRRGVKDHDSERIKLAHVLERLTLPQLQDFCLDVNDESGGGELVAVRDMFLRSEPPLVSLTLKEYESIDIINEGLIDCLMSAPLVEELTLGLHNIEYRLLFERLTVYPPGSPNRCPRICTRLTSFTIYGWRLGDKLQDWLEAAIEMALSRSPGDNDRYTDTEGEAPLGRYGTSVLSKLDIKTGRRAEAFENAELVQLVARGLVCEMDTYDDFAPRLQASIFDDESDDENPVW